MENDTVEKMFLAIMRSIGGMENQLKHVATKEDVNNAIRQHVREDHRRLSIPAGGKKKMAFTIGSLIAGAGVAIGWILEHFVMG